MKTFYRLAVISTLIVIAFFSCETTPKKPSFDDLVKNHIIPVEQSVKMYAEFQKNRTDLVEPILQDFYKDSSFVDTKFAWFSLEDMKAYMAYIEAIQQENPNKDISGIRVYFAAYPNARELNGKRIKHPRQQTIFMIPTVGTKRRVREHANLNHLPFVVQPKSSDNPLKGKFKIVEELMLDYNKKDRINTYNRSTNTQEGSFAINSLLQREETKITSTILNEGEMSPPPNEKK